MIDSHFKSTNELAIKTFCQRFKNCLGPTRGSPVISFSDEEGVSVYIPAKGDPAFWYASVRDTEKVTSNPSTVLEATQEECETVVGRWLG